jgi:hypothetical protein
VTSRIKEVLQGEEANYILPFIWQRGEEEAVIREEMARIHASGIRAVCVEARPHPDFLGPQWWRDMDVIMEEARKRGMRVWVFDDDHFPTGHAVGKIEDAPAELRRVFLQEHYVDAIGPQKNASFLITPWFSDPFRSSPAEGKTLVTAVAAARDPASDALTGGFVDLTSCVQDDVLHWDIPEGYWRVFLLIASPTGGSERQKDYVNVLVAESVRVLIDTVYEAFHERYRNDFGHTFAGFFSDEPGFYNDRQSFDYESKLGKKGVDLPWRPDMLERLEAAFGQGYRKYLPLLWHDGGELTSAVRYTYMDVVSRLYAENFTQQIGDWCRSHQVEYIGHVLEDNGVHTRLGCGAGHFFRALWGQDMSGLDVVLWQLVPGFDEGPFASVAGDADGEFYHYGLAKLGSSLAHVDPKKKGRAMCEVFGAYGWREGLKLMKWLTDHMLVRGVNHFIPHAFSQAEFPDRDCPPHMYARGKNPQYRYYQELNRYTNRVSHLLSGGRHIASAAVLYHAEAEWSAAWMPFHKPVKALMQSQIDCDVLPGDILIDAATVSGGKLLVEAESFDCLIVPYSEALPEALLSRLAELAEQGLPLLFVDDLPTRSSERSGPGDALRQLSTHSRVQSVPLGKVAHLVKEMGFFEIEVEGEQPHLRHYHVQHSDLHIYMFFNEHPYHSVETTVSLPARGRALVYDAFNNRLSELNFVEELGDMRFSLHLSPYESSVVVMGEEMQGIPVDNQYGTRPKQAAKALVVEGPWSIATATADRYPSFDTLAQAEGLPDMSLPDALPAFSGTFRYETEFEWAYSAEIVTLDLGELYETVEVWVNDQSAGVRICPPYCLDIGELVHPGKNTLVIEVTNTLANEQRDFFSRYAQQEPSGLLGPVRVIPKNAS